MLCNDGSINITSRFDCNVAYFFNHPESRARTIFYKLPIWSTHAWLKKNAMPTKVTVPGARPPTESLEQVRSSGLLEKVDARKNKACCFFDGNKARQSHARSLGLQTRQVTHQNREFTRELADPVPRKSALAGTQKLDRDWLRLKCFLGHYPLKSNHKTQPKLELLLFQFVWRIHNAWNLAGMDFLSMLTDLL